MKKFKTIYIFLLSLFPVAAVFSQTPGNAMGNFLARVLEAASLLIPLFLVLVVAAFLWGLIKYMLAAGDEEKRKAAKGYIIYGLIGLFVLIALPGIVQFLAEILGIENVGMRTIIPGFEIGV